MPGPWGTWRPIDDAALNAMLAAHRRYRESGGKEGERANFEPFDLSGRSFRGEDLAGAIFDGANLDRVDFRDAILRDATLTNTAGLSLESLGGADLTNAKLPDSVTPADELEGVAQVSTYGQTLYKILLATTSFALLTVLSARDEDLTPHKGEPTTILPLIQAGVSLATFGYVMPTIIAILYVYQQVYIKELWKRLAILPAYFPDGLALDEKAYPLSFNALIRVYSQRLSPSGADLREGYIAAALVHGPVAATALLFWFAFLKKHDWILTSYHILLIYFVCSGAYYMQWLLAPKLLGRGGLLAKPIEAGAVRPSPAQLHGVTSLLRALPRAAWRHRALNAGLAVSLGLVVLFSVVAIEDWPVSFQDALDWDYFCIDVNDKSLSTPAAGHSAGPDDDLAGVVGANLDRTKLQRARAFRAFLAKADLRYADLRDAHLANTDLRQARLGDADLRGTDFQGADLRGADFEGVSRRGTRVDKDTLLHDKSTGGNEANLMGAKLFGITTSNNQNNFWAEVKNARNYQFAFYDNTSALKVLNLCDGLFEPKAHTLNLKTKTLRNYHFEDSHLQNTDFRTYDFQGACFKNAKVWHSNLSNCNLRDTHFDGAWLDEVDVRGARLEGADFQGAHLRGANFQGTDLRDAKNLTTGQIAVILQDKETKLPAGLGKNEKDAK